MRGKNTTMGTTARTIRLCCCALAALAGAAALAAPKPKHAPAKPVVTTSTATRPDAATFNALPKLPPVSDVSDAAQHSGTSAANAAQLQRQAEFDAAEKARQDKIAADTAAYDKTEAAYKQTMEAWNKQVAACRAGDVTQCQPAPVAGQ
jgi:hypothetical protein